MRHSNPYSSLLVCVGLMIGFAMSAEAGSNGATSQFEKIVAQGVPSGSLERIMTYITESEQQSPDYATPTYVASIDFSLPSTEPRLFLINLKTAEVESYHVSHGRGSGLGRYAYKFSNKMSSNQSSLGLYQVGETYHGEHGFSVRMQGLEASNNQAYQRAIVIHGADYADPSIIAQERPVEGGPRLGLSLGCPAVAKNVSRLLINRLKGGGLLDIYHPDVMEEAARGQPIEITPPEPPPAPKPKGRKKRIEAN